MEISDFGQEDYFEGNQEAEGGRPVPTILLLMFLMLLIDYFSVTIATNIWYQQSENKKKKHLVKFCDLRSFVAVANVS